MRFDLDGGGVTPPPSGVVALRGVVEGYYGPVWTHEERLTVLRFLPEVGLNTYVYGPKDDPYHRLRWREAYPDPAPLAELAATARGLGVRFVYAVHPFGIDPDDAGDRAALAAKVRSLQAAGVTDFAIFFDDIPELTAEAGRHHGRLCRDFAALVGQHATGPLIVCPTDYAGVAPSPYRDGFAETAPRDVLLCWTGADIVVGEVTDAQAAAAATVMQRELVLWDNFPVNDFAPDRLFLGPLVARPADPRSVAGILANPMIQAVPSLVAIATVGEYAQDPAGYDPHAAWHRAIARVATLTGAAADDLAVLARACGGWPPSAPRWADLETALDEALDGRTDAAAAYAARMVAAGTGLSVAPAFAPFGAALAAAGDLVAATCTLLRLPVTDDVDDAAGAADDDRNSATATVVERCEQVTALAVDVLRPQVLAFAQAALRRTTTGATATTPGTTDAYAQGFDWAAREHQHTTPDTDEETP